MDTALQSAISESIQQATGASFEIQSAQSAHGGCIHSSTVVRDGNTAFFIKTNSASNARMFACEARALESLKASRCIKVPTVIAQGNCGQTSFLILEALELSRSGQDSDWEAFGTALARLHRHSSERFGWTEDNYIGATLQPNNWRDKWADFFRDHRLVHQFDLAKQKGFSFVNSDDLIGSVQCILKGHEPKPSLLHGDLWSGNAAFLSDATPVIYDPACYYGDRETDLAFSELFGGFPTAFYNAYQTEWPLPKGYGTRKTLYNLYHVLNHLNLFGGSYAIQADQMIGELLSSK